MKTIKTGLLLWAGLMAFSSVSFAAKKHSYQNAEHEQTVYARVIEVIPVYKSVRVSHPVQKCWQQPMATSHFQYRGSSSAGSTLAGGLIGGIIGHQIGDGRGNKLATALGTMIGARAGYDAGRDLDFDHYDRFSGYQEVCEVETRSRIEEVADGYDVKYLYNGNRYQTHMPYRPGQRIQINVSVNPVF